jgi:GTP-binding protein YchF
MDAARCCVRRGLGLAWWWIHGSGARAHTHILVCVCIYVVLLVVCAHAGPLCMCVSRAAFGGRCMDLQWGILYPWRSCALDPPRAQPCHFCTPVGLPNVGKSSLTNLLSGANHAEAANYPFCTIDPSEFFCVVPDKNFSYLVDVFKPSSIVPAALKVTDIAGLIKGASEGAGLGNAFLSHIAAVDGIYHLVRGFESDEVIHVDDSVDPVRDMETIVSELCLKDLAVLSTVINTEKDRIRKEKGKARAVDVPVGEVFQEAYDKCLALLESRTPIQTCETFTAGHVELIRDWGLITTKPVIYVVNLSQPNFIKKGSKWLPKIKQWVDSHGGGQIIPVSVDFEEACVAKSNESPEALQGTSCVRVYTH